MSKQFGLKEVLDVAVHNFSTSGAGDVRFFIDYANNVQVSLDSERLDLRGGKGNYVLLSFDHTKTASMSMTVPLVDLEVLASVTGKDLVTGTTQVPKREVLTVSATNTVTLSQTPVTGTLKIYLLEDSRDHGTEQTVGDPATTENTYSITNTTVTFNATTCPEGTKVVCYYDYQSTATARKIIFTADDFPGYFRITGEGLMTDEYDGYTYPVVFDFKKAKIKPNFQFTMASDAATELTLEFDLYPVDSDGDKIYFETTVLSEAV